MVYQEIPDVCPFLVEPENLLQDQCEDHPECYQTTELRQPNTDGSCHGAVRLGGHCLEDWEVERHGSAANIVTSEVLVESVEVS